MKFTKMHGLGNDFIIIEDIEGKLNNLEDLAIRICDRHSGIGADGILVVLKTHNADIKMRIINSDGSEANMCGNGVRCFAKYVYDKKIVVKDSIEIETLAGVMVAQLSEKKGITLVKINMGTPSFEKESIPFVGEMDNMNYSLGVNNRNYKASTILMGVPHTVLYVDSIKDDEIIETGKIVEKLPKYPERTNVNFVRIIDRDTIEIKTWERGAGLTLACGTGTCAGVVASFMNNLTNNRVVAKLALGSMNIEYDGKTVFMEGPASYICEGNILI